MRPSRSVAVVAALLALLAGCEREVILEGERLDPRALSPGGPVDAVPGNRAEPISLPAAVNHGAWTHRGGSPTHTIAHPALSAQPALLWSRQIGEGESRRYRITADPVAADGRIFTLDASSTVAATGADGTPLWSRDITPPWAGRGAPASGGGLAYGNGRVFVGSAFGQLVALDAASGAEIWRQRFDAPVTGAPTVRGNRVYVVSADSGAYALDAADGKIVWQRVGTPSPSAMTGGPAPAVTDRNVLMPLGTGDLVTLVADNGVELWNRRIAGQRTGIAAAGVTDISGDPVVVGNTVYVGNRSGRVTALDLSSGQPQWTAREGAFGPVWPVGGSVFLISDQGELLRLDARTGERIWGVPMARFLDERERRRAEVVAHHGPILAGGRLIVASNDGVMRSFDPVSGALLGAVEVPGGATTRPIVVGGTLYVVSTDGRLHAFR